MRRMNAKKGKSLFFPTPERCDLWWWKGCTTATTPTTNLEYEASEI